MAKNENKKVPGALIAIVAVVVAVAVFVPTVYMPYKNKKPIMDSEHAEAVSTINYYEESIANQANIEKDIAQLKVEWEKFQKDMFVDASSSLADLNDSIKETDIHLNSFERGAETPDESGMVSFTGSPLYYVSINISGYCDHDTLIDFLKFVEEDSVGCYYVKTLSASTLDEDKKIGDYTAKKGDLSFGMEIYLYYYNQKITVEVEETDTESTEESAV